PACGSCPIKSKCTPGAQRTIHRLVDQSALDRMEERIHTNPSLMTIRRCTVEHPFGTIKAAMGATHFQMRRLRNVRTEMALHVLAYNLKRVMNIIGARALLAGIRP
ncbi:MAG: transposase, partial [Alcanivorax sp.]|nr:transposase [Alcanivorax sp.]